VRRAAIVTALAGLTLAACAAPEFTLRPRFSAGERREYRLQADATVLITGSSASSTQRTTLRATTLLEVIDITNGVTTIALTLTPRSLLRDGRSADPPPAQKILITVGGDGRVRTVTTSGDRPVDLESADVEDLVPLIGPPLPPRRVHLADRWTAQPAASPSPSPGGSASPAPTASSTVAAPMQEARLASLGIVGGYDCAIVALSTRRPVTRDRVAGGTLLRLQGTEYAAGEIAFAFREGFPVSVRSSSEARLAVSSASGRGGSVVIETTTTLTLVRRSVRGPG
jgi:hypothetical protein